MSFTNPNVCLHTYFPLFIYLKRIAVLALFSVCSSHSCCCEYQWRVCNVIQYMNIKCLVLSFVLEDLCCVVLYLTTKCLFLLE